LNDLLLTPDYTKKMLLLMNEANEGIAENDVLFPVLPLRYEEQILNEIKYLNTLLGVEQLESKQSPNRNLSNQKLKEEIKKL